MKSRFKIVRSKENLLCNENNREAAAAECTLRLHHKAGRLAAQFFIVKEIVKFQMADDDRLKGENALGPEA